MGVLPPPLGWECMELDLHLNGRLAGRLPTVVDYDVNSSRMGEKNSMPRKKNEDFRNVVIDYRADVAPIETSCWAVVLEEERVRGSDGGPIENDLEVVVAVQDVHDAGGGFESRSTLRVAASCSILLVEAVGHPVLNVENNHILAEVRESNHEGVEDDHHTRAVAVDIHSSSRAGACRH